jgi:hypothetical protein
MTVPQGFRHAGHQVFLRAILDEPNNRFVMRVCDPDLHFDSDHRQANGGAGPEINSRGSSIIRRRSLSQNRKPSCSTNGMAQQTRRGRTGFNDCRRTAQISGIVASTCLFSLTPSFRCDKDDKRQFYDRPGNPR